MFEMQEPLTVPLEHCGKWIAWDFEETRILAACDSYAETKQAAQAQGEQRPVLVKVPPAEVRFIGGHR